MKAYKTIKINIFYLKMPTGGLMAYNLHETKTNEKIILKQLDEEVMESR